MNRTLTLLLFCSLLATVPAQTSSSSERLFFFNGPDGGLQIQINAGKPFALSELRESNASLTRDGVTVRADGEGLWMQSSLRPIAFELAGPGDVRGSLPPDSALKLEVPPNRGEAILAAPATNRQPAQLEFNDSGKAELPAGGFAHTTFFDDGTYSLAASTNVVATTADGIPFRFTHHSGPMFGGKLREQTDVRGNRRIMRSSPLVRIDLSGSPDGEVRVASLGTSLLAGQEKLLTFTNGAQVFVKHDLARSSVEWQVVKGVCQFTIAGFSCWRAVATTGQSGSLQWNPQKHVIDLKHDNKSEGGGSILAHLSGRISASVSAGATFQYAQFQDCGSFATSALGEVALLDRETGEVIPMKQASISYNEGARVGQDTAVTGRAFAPITLVWDSDDRILLRGGGTSYPVTAGTEQILRFGGDNLSAAYNTDGSVILRAATGNFNITPVFLQELSFDIPDGGALVLRLNRQRLLFTAQAAPNTSVQIRVVSGGQTYMYLFDQARITVVLGQNSILPEGSPAWIFFEGAGGDQTFLSGPQPGPTIGPGRIESDRIVQAPVSVIE